jgi:hypothetical protein
LVRVGIRRAVSHCWFIENRDVGFDPWVASAIEYMPAEEKHVCGLRIHCKRQGRE